MTDLKTLENKLNELEKRLELIETRFPLKDPLYNDARRLVIKHGKATVMFLQLKLLIGMERAARILDDLEKAGVVSPATGGEPRKIVVKE